MRCFLHFKVDLCSLMDFVRLKIHSKCNLKIGAMRFFSKHNNTALEGRS